jgi:hypothetical protein
MVTFEDACERYQRAFQRRAEADKAHVAASQQIRALNDLFDLRVTLPSGIRICVSDVWLKPTIHRRIAPLFGQPDIVVGELALNDLSTSDLLVLHQIRNAIDLWQKGTITELTRPEKPFGRWPNMSFCYDDKPEEPSR